MSGLSEPAWRSALARVWSRAGLGAPPAAGRTDSLELSIDRRTVRFSPTPDERGLVLRVSVRTLPTAQIGPEAALLDVMRAETGFFLGSAGALRLIERDGTAELVVEDVIFPDLHDDDAVDFILSACVERAAFQAARWQRSTGAAAAFSRPAAVRADVDAPFEMIFRP